MKQFIIFFDVWFLIWYHIIGFVLSSIKKLIQKAKRSPQNLTFNEFCKLCEHFGMEQRNIKGSHVVYKRKTEPIFSLPIQNNNGKAIPYQVHQLFSNLEEHGLYDPEEED